MTFSGKKALVCGYGHASRGCAMALKQRGADVFVAVADPNRATQAFQEGFWVIKKAPHHVASEADILVVVANFNMDNIDVPSNSRNMMENNVIYYTDPILGHNSSIPVAVLEPYFANKYVIVVSDPGYPNLMPSCSTPSHVVPMRESEVQAADPVSVPSQERPKPFTPTPAGEMSMSKMLIMLIQVAPIIGALAYALSKASKAEFSLPFGVRIKLNQ